MKKLLLGGAALLTLVCQAHAATVQGRVSVFGTVLLDPTNQVVTFSDGRPFSPTATAPGDPFTVVVTETGDFLNLGTGGSLTWRNEHSSIGFNNFGSGSDLSCGTACLFTGANNGYDISFSIASFASSYADPTFTVLGTGIISLTGFDPTLVPFSLTTQGGLNLGFSSGAPPLNPVPLPAALPMFLAGLIGIGVLARRRRVFSRNRG